MVFWLRHALVYGTSIYWDWNNTYKTYKAMVVIAEIIRIGCIISLLHSWENLGAFGPIQFSLHRVLQYCIDYLELIFRYFLPTEKDAINAFWHKRNKLIIYEVGYNQFPRKGYLGYLKLLKAFTVHITLQFPLVIYSCICYKQISVYLEYDQHASYPQ